MSAESAAANSPVANRAPDTDLVERAGGAGESAAGASKKSALRARKPYLDVWSRTDAKHRKRAVYFLASSFLLFCGLCTFTYWLHTARVVDFSYESYAAPLRVSGAQTQTLNDFILYPISVDQTPMHGVVLGLLLASIFAVPISVAIFYRFPFALPFVAAVGVLAHHPWMAVTLVFSCILASVRPFRLSFRFGSGLLGMLPVILYLYLATRGGEQATSASPEDRLLLAGPWALAILGACAMLAASVFIAYLVQYRPGAITPVMAVMFVMPVALFHAYVGADELGYRVLESRYGPRSARFEPSQDAGERIRALIHQWTAPGREPDALRGVLGDNPAAQAELRQRVARKIYKEFLDDRREAYQACADFIADHPASRYTPNVLFIQATALDTRLDERRLNESAAQRVLYADYPHVQSEPVWNALLGSAPESPLACAAGLRCAQLRLRRGDVDGALALLEQVRMPPPRAAATQPGVPRLLRNEPAERSLGFEPAPYVFEAQRLREMILANRGDPRWGDDPLRELASLDPHRALYEEHLAGLAARFRDASLHDNLVVLWCGSFGQRAAQIANLSQFVRENETGDALPEAAFRLADLEVQSVGADREALRSAGIARMREVAGRFGASCWGRAAAERLRILEPIVASASGAAP